MKKYSPTSLSWFVVLFIFGLSDRATAQTDTASPLFKSTQLGSLLLFALILVPLAIYLIRIAYGITKIGGRLGQKKASVFDNESINNLGAEQIDILLNAVDKQKNSDNSPKMVVLAVALASWLSPPLAQAQTTVEPATRATIMSQPGVIITLVLIFIPLLVAFVVLVAKIKNLLQKVGDTQVINEAQTLVEQFEQTDHAADVALLEQRKKTLAYHLTNHELAGANRPTDEKGLLNNIVLEQELHLFPVKKRPAPRPKIDPAQTWLILAFLGSAIFWLVVGTTVGEYLGIKFVAPDADTISWLSFGRLRPVHTNLVFWAWASLGMLGLGYYVVPMVGNGPLASIRMGWYSLHAINLAHVLGTLSLMAGINNGGGEYREYIWPIMFFFAAGLLLSMVNYLQTIAIRKSKEIYIANWYIMSAVIFLPIIAVVSYLPFWQNGISEVILQGFYMHQAVGLWFMMFCLGLLYYFLPQQFNKPIYSYSLGVLAFWTQILFYTLIGTHHFVFSALPWWLQTTAIVGSAGMLIPVTSGTINFLMTFRGGWNKVSGSYSLPFFLVGVVYYFTGSYQGTAEAFRSTNLIWHFTDFTIAHSHITMYGIITFIIFAGIYAIVPRLTGNEPSQLLVGAHFWLALIGLQFYTIPLMIGGTLKGLSWAEGKPFIDGVVLMAPYWLWRAIGGSMMWLAHLVLAYNFYQMVFARKPIDVREEAFKLLASQTKLTQS